MESWLDSGITVATWNVEWAAAGTRRGDRVAGILASVGDVLVVTECTLDVLPPGHVVTGGSDWGYRVDDASRRKVALWSRWPWVDVDDVGHPDLPPGRFVAATTATPIGELRIVGVCIPWAGAHVSSGRRDRRQWEDHELFLQALPEVLAEQPGPLVVAGDFNQRLPRRRQPERVHQLLLDALGDLQVVTAGETDVGFLIDHIAVGDGLATGAPTIIPSRDAVGQLSDHHGVGSVVQTDRPLR